MYAVGEKESITWDLSWVDGDESWLTKVSGYSLGALKGFFSEYLEPLTYFSSYESAVLCIYCCCLAKFSFDRPIGDLLKSLGLNCMDRLFRDEREWNMFSFRRSLFSCITL